MTEYDPLDIAGQTKEAEQARRKAEREARQEAEDIKWLMTAKRGRRIVWLLLDRAGVFRTSFSSDPLVMAWNEGNRNTGNRMLSLINGECPDLYIKMLKEQDNERND